MEMMTTMPTMPSVPQGATGLGTNVAGIAVTGENNGAGLSLFADILLGMQLPDVSQDAATSDAFPLMENAEPVKDEKEKGDEEAIFAMALPMVPMMALPATPIPVAPQIASQTVEVSAQLRTPVETTAPVELSTMPLAQQETQVVTKVTEQGDAPEEMLPQDGGREEKADFAQLLTDEVDQQLAPPEKQMERDPLLQQPGVQTPGKHDPQRLQEASSQRLTEAGKGAEAAFPVNEKQENPRLRPEQVEVAVIEKKTEAEGGAKVTELPHEISFGHSLHAVNGKSVVEHQAPAQPVSREVSQSILSQVKEGMITHDGKGNGTISIKLSPEELGNLQITLNLDDRRLKVEVIADNPAVKEALASNIDSLKETFLRQNLRMEQFDVATGGQSFSRQFEQGFNDRREAPKAFAVNPFLTGTAVEEQVQKVYIGDRRQGLVDLRL